MSMPIGSTRPDLNELIARCSTTVHKGQYVALNDESDDLKFVDPGQDSIQADMGIDAASLKKAICKTLQLKEDEKSVDEKFSKCLKDLKLDPKGKDLKVTGEQLAKILSEFKDLNASKAALEKPEVEDPKEETPVGLQLPKPGETLKLTREQLNNRLDGWLKAGYTVNVRVKGIGTYRIQERLGKLDDFMFKAYFKGINGTTESEVEYVLPKNAIFHVSFGEPAEEPKVLPKVLNIEMEDGEETTEKPKETEKEASRIEKEQIDEGDDKVAPKEDFAKIFAFAKEKRLKKFAGRKKNLEAGNKRADNFASGKIGDSDANGKVQFEKLGKGEVDSKTKTQKIDMPKDLADIQIEKPGEKSRTQKIVVPEERTDPKQTKTNTEVEQTEKVSDARGKVQLEKLEEGEVDSKAKTQKIDMPKDLAGFQIEKPGEQTGQNTDVKQPEGTLPPQELEEEISIEDISEETSNVFEMSIQGQEDNKNAVASPVEEGQQNKPEELSKQPEPIKQPEMKSEDKIVSPINEEPDPVNESNIAEMSMQGEKDNENAMNPSMQVEHQDETEVQSKQTEETTDRLNDSNIVEKSTVEDEPPIEPTKTEPIEPLKPIKPTESIKQLESTEQTKPPANVQKAPKVNVQEAPKVNAPVAPIEIKTPKKAEQPPKLNEPTQNKTEVQSKQTETIKQTETVKQTEQVRTEMSTGQVRESNRPQQINVPQMDSIEENMRIIEQQTPSSNTCYMWSVVNALKLTPKGQAFLRTLRKELEDPKQLQKLVSEVSGTPKGAAFVTALKGLPLKPIEKTFVLKHYLSGQDGHSYRRRCDRWAELQNQYPGQQSLPLGDVADTAQIFGLYLGDQGTDGERDLRITAATDEVAAQDICFKVKERIGSGKPVVLNENQQHFFAVEDAETDNYGRSFLICRDSNSGSRGVYQIYPLKDEKTLTVRTLTYPRNLDGYINLVMSAIGELASKSGSQQSQLLRWIKVDVDKILPAGQDRDAVKNSMRRIDEALRMMKDLPRDLVESVLKSEQRMQDLPELYKELQNNERLGKKNDPESMRKFYGALANILEDVYQGVSDKLTSE